MTKTELIEKVALQNDLSKAKAKDVVNSVFEAIKEGVLNEGKASFQGFGNFTKTTRAARKGRNPQTGEQIKIAAKDVIKFKSQF